MLIIVQAYSDPANDIWSNIWEGREGNHNCVFYVLTEMVNRVEETIRTDFCMSDDHVTGEMIVLGISYAAQNCGFLFPSSQSLFI